MQVNECDASAGEKRCFRATRSRQLRFLLTCVAGLAPCLPSFALQNSQDWCQPRFLRLVECGQGIFRNKFVRAVCRQGIWRKKFVHAVLRQGIWRNKFVRALLHQNIFHIFSFPHLTIFSKKYITISSLQRRCEQFSFSRELSTSPFCFVRVSRRIA